VQGIGAWGELVPAREQGEKEKRRERNLPFTAPSLLLSL
jgi:hypothetical protein